MNRRGALLAAVTGLLVSGGCGMPADRLVDRQAPDFTLTSLDGKEVSLSDFRGKVVVLAFWGAG
jgi:cytochrome oxidase Cu insertion factor (SCO1/SenC/PrrC family)